MANQKENKVKEVAALRYSPDSNKAPEIVAVGKGDIAEKILETARNSNVPIHTNDALAHTLAQMNIGDEIPPELYEVVAEVLVFVSNLDKSYGEKYASKK